MAFEGLRRKRLRRRRTQEAQRLARVRRFQRAWEVRQGMRRFMEEIERDMVAGILQLSGYPWTAENLARAKVYGQHEGWAMLPDGTCFCKPGEIYFSMLEEQ